MSDPNYADVVTTNCRPMEPIATDQACQLAQLEAICAVLFDVYGTLLISASGDIGANDGDHRIAALLATCNQLDVELKCLPAEGIHELENAISSAHTAAKWQGIDYPEVNIVEIWQSVLAEIATAPIDYRRFALEYEVRANPVWQMPEAANTLDQLTQKGLVLGVVSNAQYFTPLLFEPLLGKSLEGFGFDPSLLYFSYEYLQAKPGNHLYRLAKDQLSTRGVTAEQVLYVGNDLLNDVTAAASVGFRTALFAGDRRSLRLREGDERVAGVQPDVVVTSLEQLLECVV